MSTGNSQSLNIHNIACSAIHNWMFEHSEVIPEGARKFWSGYSREIPTLKHLHSNVMPMTSFGRPVSTPVSNGLREHKCMELRRCFCIRYEIKWSKNCHWTYHFVKVIWKKVEIWSEKRNWIDLAIFLERDYLRNNCTLGIVSLCNFCLLKNPFLNS